mmetsp:Transcript_118402/g.215371  ORF Transcript_118402/g.215371 Transcript_118402/m.215371 type:complete len:138 (+) Transcript_118402:180-593(+)
MRNSGADCPAQHPEMSTPEQGRHFKAPLLVLVTVSAVVARLVLPTILRQDASTSGYADLVEEILSCTYTVFGLMLIAQRAQHSKAGHQEDNSDATPDSASDSPDGHPARPGRWPSMCMPETLARHVDYCSTFASLLF